MGPCDVKGSTYPLPALGFCAKYDAMALDSLPRYSNIHLRIYIKKFIIVRTLRLGWIFGTTYGRVHG